MPFERYWTTNYDVLLETAIGAPAIVTSDASLKNADPNKKWTVKLNGSIGDPNLHLVYSREHFEAFERENPALHRYLLTSLATCSFLFLGFSMSDPTLTRALERIRGESAHRTECPHFVIAAKNSEPYGRRRQQYWAKELGRFGVETVLVESHDDVLDLVRRLASRVAKRTVCVIGGLAAEDRTVRGLCEALGRQLVDNGLSLVTGCGHHVGTFCALSALNRIEQGVRSPGAVSVRTYFRKGGGSSLLRFGETVFVGNDYSEMRREMLRCADVAIAIAGRDGAGEEIQLATAFGIPVVPIASTGGAAMADWRSGHRSLLPVIDGIRDVRQKRALLSFLGSLNAHEKASERVPRLIRALQIILEWKAVGGEA
jgi:predicted Rossmann-fold nucleotide-binding protein